MKTTILNSLKTLETHLQKEIEIRKQIYFELNQYIAENAEFQTGDKVNIYDIDTNKFVGVGIVGNIKHILHSTLFLDYIKYTINPKNFDNIISCIKYEMFAIKKDGEKSNNHLFTKSPYMVFS